MSLQQATVVQRPAESGGSVTRAMESTQFSYQSQAVSSRQQLGNSYSELRQFETSMFFSRNRSLCQTLSSETGQRVESTGRSVARQTDSLAGDEATLNQYLDGVDGLVDNILADTVAYVQDTLGSFLTDVQAAFGLSEAESDDFVAMIADEVGAFLDDARSVLDGNESPQLEADEAELALV